MLVCIYIHVRVCGWITAARIRVRIHTPAIRSRIKWGLHKRCLRVTIEFPRR